MSWPVLNFCRYGPLWITTTLIFMLAALGNFATYLMQKKRHLDIWNFDVGYFNWAASVMYGYAIIVPAIFFFLFQYFGSRPSLVRFWCMWGYSLFVFIPASVSILVPSICFHIYITGNDMQFFTINEIGRSRNSFLFAATIWFLERFSYSKASTMLPWLWTLFCLLQVLLLIPVEFLRWVIIALAGGASSWFIALNLKECTEGADLMVLIASASVLQFALALFIKVFFFAWVFLDDFAKVRLFYIHCSILHPWHSFNWGSWFWLF